MDHFLAIAPYLALIPETASNAVEELQKRLVLFPSVGRDDYALALRIRKRVNPLTYHLAFGGFIDVLRHLMNQLIAAYKELDMPRLAWAGRCCLEYYIWINYCKIDEAHMSKFHEDAFKDVNAFSNAMAVLWEIPRLGERGAEQSATNKKALRDDAQLSKMAHRAGITPTDERQRPIYQAAIELECEIQFRTLNSLFSKCTHTGPHSIMWTFNAKAHKQYCDMFMHLATAHALACYDLLQRFITEENSAP